MVPYFEKSGVLISIICSYYCRGWFLVDPSFQQNIAAARIKPKLNPLIHLKEKYNTLYVICSYTS